MTGIFPERNYGLTASGDVVDLVGMQLRWFDHWLKGEDNGVEQDKPVKLFVMGLDQWREEDDWPLPYTQFRPYYLHSAGHANSAAKGHVPPTAHVPPVLFVMRHASGENGTDGHRQRECVGHAWKFEDKKAHSTLNS